MAEIILDENEDWEKRILCSDESCIGTIGPDGKCKECGKLYEGKLPNNHTGRIVDKEASVEKGENDIQANDDWDNRILCSDESCIGVIGSDGKCKECGKPL
ncbi:MAG: hypothetical protein KBG22_07955 [Smithella sp.]|nr:hypothetical protein [Smithella sp.]MDM7985811.1 hypothetical protein [Smithella sp.]HOU52012.1 hypothetical protein [Smithella sp.]HQG66017.1 hypothetical protein [Smithella sp.]HQH17632.1 hypothetical protein [Smithella sp.]